jgi:energy-coupling factor transporter ATP-binding protein EcfA2
MTFTDFLPTLLIILAVAGFLQYLGWLDSLIDRLAGFGVYTLRWLFDISGAVALLPEKLAYRDFVEKLDIVETKKGWFWTGVEIIPVSSDGLSNNERNKLGEIFNNFYTTLPAKTRCQVITVSDNDASIASKVLNPLTKQNKNSVFAPVLLSRRNFLLRKAKAGEIRSTKTYVFFGREASQININKGLLKGLLKWIKSTYKSEPFLDLELAEVNRVRAELLAIRSAFITNYKLAWGQLDNVVRPLKPSEIFTLAWQRLNPELAKITQAPIYDREVAFSLLGDDGFDKNNASNGNNVGNANNSNISISSKLQDVPLKLNKRSFVDNPREILCQTKVVSKEDYFLYGSTYCMTLSVSTFPTNVFPTMVELVSRSREVNFPVQIATHFLTQDRADTLDFLSKRQNSARNSLKRSGTNPDEIQEIQTEQYKELIRVITNENQVAGKIGFAITFWANNKIELYRRRDLLINLVRQMQGLTINAERHCSFDLHLTTMPCTPHGSADTSHGDFRERLGLSREIAAFTPFTGGPTAIPRGVTLDKSTYVLETRTRELFAFDTNPQNRIFRNGMTLIVGQAGSGKSALLNLLRLHLLLTRRGVTIDYNSSASRLVKAVGGLVIDITKPSQTKGLGLFAIRPQPGEVFEKDELNEYGIPKHRILAVQEMLARLCMDDPLADNPTPLDAEMVSVLADAVKTVYARMVNMNPIIDDFIFTLRAIPEKEKRPLALKLAARLELFNANSQLGHWLNDRSDPLPLSTYVVFEFSGAKNLPKLRLIASMALVQYVDRVIHSDPYAPKFLDVDELGEIAKEKVLAETIDQLIRTARKKQTVVTVASQDPRDFDASEKLRAIESSCEIKYIFETQNPVKTAQSLNLTPGQYKAISSLRPATKDYSEFLLKYPSPQPGGGSAIIRLSYSPVEARLVAGAGNEIATVAEAIADAKSTGLPIHPNLIAAIEMPALVGRATQTQASSQASTNNQANLVNSNNQTNILLALAQNQTSQTAKRMAG